MKYIDADLLRAVIKEHTLFYAGQANLLDGTNALDGYDEVLAIIDSLQQEQPEVFDTVAFQKGVEEGRRLEKEDAEHLRDATKKISEDLEEAARAFVGFDMDCDELYEYETGIAAFKEGAAWQKRKMMEGAVETDGEVCKLADRVWITPTDEKRFHQDVFDNFKPGDEVRIIILPNDEDNDRTIV